MTVHARYDARKHSPEERLKAALDRNAFDRWHAALNYVHVVNSTGGEARIFYPSPLGAGVKRTAADVGAEFALLYRLVEREVVYDLASACDVTAGVGAIVLWGRQGSEDVWTVGDRYRVTAAVDAVVGDRLVPALVVTRADQAVAR